jgi:formylglycine-generating enzyme required for sulfatase activity
MAGNVAEWTESSYDKGSYNFDSGLNPNISDSTNLRKVTRGRFLERCSLFFKSKY